MSTHTIFGTPLLTAQEKEDSVIELENSIGTISPGLLGSCPECQSAHGMEPREFFHHVHVAQDVYDEGSFSWQDCEACGSHLGGDRYAAHAWDPTTREMTHLDICQECVWQIANGEPPYTNEQED